MGFFDKNFVNLNVNLYNVGKEGEESVQKKRGIRYG